MPRRETELRNGVDPAEAPGNRSFGDHFLPGERNVPRHQRIFCNRNLRMDSIRAIGFDMDHTLALYDRRTFEQLTFDMAVENLVGGKRYPEVIRGIEYQPDFIIRGLVVDKRLGNVLKMDAHGYIAQATHGTRKLTKQERLRCYRNLRVNLRSDRYQSFDTLFSMPEGSLYAAILDLKERDPDGPLRSVKLARIFDDVRSSVDQVHRDGSLKNVIMQNLSRYFVADPNLRATLLRFRALGKKLFLLTNSEYEYTDAVLSHLLDRDGESWKDLFDLIIAESRKPAFFMNGNEPVPIPTPESAREAEFCFRGSNASHVESFLGARGDEVLYFGDHTYGDILRSKKTVGWRTAMICFELEHEIKVHTKREPLHAEARDLVSRAQDLSRDRDEIALLLSAMRERIDVSYRRSDVPEWARGFTARELRDFLQLDRKTRQERLEELESILKGLDFIVAQTVARAKVLEDRVRDAHNPYWGWLLREGNKASRFGRQVQEFACIYTSRVANFLNYPGNFYFIAPEERLPHER